MNERTGSDLFVDALERYGVSHIFGNPGTTELPIVDATERSDLEYVLAAHEDIATGMAAGYASTRRYHADEAGGRGGEPGDRADPAEDRAVLPLGVANLHLAPGLAHGLGNVYGASVAGAPLLVTAGNHARHFEHEEPLLTGDQEALVDQWTKWSATVKDVEALPTMLRRAVRTALTPPTGPVFLSLPVDVAMAETDAAIERLGPIPTAGRGDEAQIQRAADLVADADDVVLVVGDGIARSGTDAIDAAVDLAEAAGARVHAEILASEIDFPTDHDQFVSYVPPDEDLARNLLGADVLCLVGCSTNTTLTHREGPLVPKETTCIHVGDDAWELGKNQPADAAVIGDPGEVAAQLADRVAERLDDATREERLTDVAAQREFVGAKMDQIGEDDAPDDPRASKAALADALEAVAGDAFVVDEGVTSKYAMLTRWEFAPEQYVSNKGGGLGYGLPASVGAAIAESQRGDPRDVVGFVADGSYLYYPHSIYSAVRQGVDLTVVIPDNRNYRILADNAAHLLGGEGDDYEWDSIRFDPPVDIPTNAESHGATGHLVETPDELDETLRTAYGSEGVDVVDVLVHD
ncbi:thiamine pyrophosphate-binding protein [Salinarchaeum laminariae]|uniref:thiamine pyrophosphate-binding protein n=1 Tax=Salinarchaeum laminariae TaxID=869888 RepID=UPI0020BFCCC2|nr:thiamine pyrophosphate-binding protein [Salinarchaeum laminariae]